MFCNLVWTTGTVVERSLRIRYKTRILTTNTRASARVEVTARARKHRQAQRQARQAKSNRENRYVIKVTRLNREGGAVPLVGQNQRMHFMH